MLRTPDERFTSLPEFPFQPHYCEVAADGGDAFRVHYLDEGPVDGSIVVLMHGEPSWCYLWRRVIPPLVDAGLRVVAPDLVGFGRSDKPADVRDHTYAAHVAWMRAIVFDALDLRDKETEGHTRRVTELTLELAKEFDFTNDDKSVVPLNGDCRR